MYKERLSLFGFVSRLKRTVNVPRAVLDATSTSHMAAARGFPNSRHRRLIRFSFRSFIVSFSIPASRSLLSMFSIRPPEYVFLTTLSINGSDSVQFVRFPKNIRKNVNVSLTVCVFSVKSVQLSADFRSNLVLVTEYAFRQ